MCAQHYAQAHTEHEEGMHLVSSYRISGVPSICIIDPITGRFHTPHLTSLLGAILPFTSISDLAVLVKTNKQASELRGTALLEVLRLNN